MTLTRWLLCGAALALLEGCQNLPDVQPFTDATVSLRSAIAESGSTVVTELKQTPLAGVTTEATKLENAWAARNAAMSALVDYSTSLQAIVDSGKKGDESARKVLDAANKLAGTLGAANLLVGASGQLATDTIAFVSDQIARVRAAKSLEAALQEMQPVVESIARLLAADLKRSDEIITVAVRAESQGLAEDSQREVAYREQLLATRGQLMSSVAAELHDGKKATELSHADELTRISELMAKNEAWAADYDRKQAAIATRGRAAHELLAAAVRALPDWAAAHAKLLAAVSAKRPPDLTELTDSTKRIRDLVDRYRNL